MPRRQRVGAISRRWPGLGPALYVACLQYFIVQVVVADQWRPDFSWSRNTISDLGNTVCGRWNGQPFCSPRHDLMNVSFVVLGLCTLVGSLLNRQLHLDRRGASIGFWCMEAAGLGVVLVGLFPENTVGTLHGTGAALSFVFGNVGIIVLGWTLGLPLAFRLFSVGLGVLALVALIAYETSHFIGLGHGGLERVVAYPQTAWLIVLGAYLLAQLRRTQALSASPEVATRAGGTVSDTATEPGGDVGHFGGRDEP